MNIVYSGVALNDLIRLREFVAQKNPAAAWEIADTLITKINTLLDFPLMGKEVFLAAKPRSIRDLIVGKYVVRYLINDQDINILKIWHHREDRN